MNLRTFIERPVLSAVISITIVVVGIIGLFSLPVEQYPDIAPPTIMVSTTYYGASAETLQKSVIAPLEEAINGVEDMTYMTSTATNAGTSSREQTRTWQRSTYRTACRERRDSFRQK